MGTWRDKIERERKNGGNLRDGKKVLAREGKEMRGSKDTRDKKRKMCSPVSQVDRERMEEMLGSGPGQKSSEKLPRGLEAGKGDNTGRHRSNKQKKQNRNGQNHNPQGPKIREQWTRRYRQK